MTTTAPTRCERDEIELMHLRQIAAALDLDAGALTREATEIAASTGGDLGDIAHDLRWHLRNGIPADIAIRATRAGIPPVCVVDIVRGCRAVLRGDVA
jgi:hypothetical protein